VAILAILLVNLFADNQTALVSPNGEVLLKSPLTKLKVFAGSNKAAFT